MLPWWHTNFVCVHDPQILLFSLRSFNSESGSPNCIYWLNNRRITSFNCRDKSTFTGSQFLVTGSQKSTAPLLHSRRPLNGGWRANTEPRSIYSLLTFLLELSQAALKLEIETISLKLVTSIVFWVDDLPEIFHRWNHHQKTAEKEKFSNSNLDA